MFWRKKKPTEPELTKAAEGSKLLEEGFAAKAEPLLSQAVKEHPDDHKVWGNLGVARLYLQQFDEALTALRKAVKLAPGQPTHRLNLAVALHQSGRTEEAVRELRALCQTHPEVADVHFNLAVALASLDEIDEAIEELRVEITLDRRHQRAITLLANLLQVQMSREQ